MTGIPERLERCAKVFVGPRDTAGKSELARRAGIPLRMLNKYFAGSKLPLDRAAAIAKASGKSLLWLATGEGPELANDLPVRNARPASADSTLWQRAAAPGPADAGFAELAAAALFPPAASIDTELLRDVVTAIERALREKKMELPPEKKAEAVTFLYESSAADHAINEAALARVLRLVA